MNKEYGCIAQFWKKMKLQLGFFLKTLSSSNMYFVLRRFPKTLDSCIEVLLRYNESVCHSMVVQM